MPAPEPPSEARYEAALARRDGGLTRRRFVMGASSVAALAGTGALTGGCGATTSPLPVREIGSLPRPRHSAPLPLEQALAARRSHRDFTPQPLTELEISQLLWAAQGVTAEWGARTAPSAGGLYPLELYLLTPDAYRHYRPEGHRVELLALEDLRPEAAAAALHQPAVGAAALAIVITAVYARTVKKYGARGRRYVELEAGHAAQNVLLQAVSLGLAAVPIGSFDDQRLAQALRLPSDRAPLYIVAVGHAR
jgi:SagB-type dehydrogenase family enzyme